MPSRTAPSTKASENTSSAHGLLSTARTCLPSPAISARGGSGSARSASTHTSAQSAGTVKTSRQPARSPSRPPTPVAVAVATAITPIRLDRAR